MKNRSHYVFGAALASLAIGGIPGLVNKAGAAAITAAKFTFEQFPTGTSGSTTAASVGPFLAESGTGTAMGVHVASIGSSTSTTFSPTSTVWSVPAGNGSPHSLNANHWGTGDYYQFSVPTTGIQDIMVSFDDTSSSTGPKVFSLLASADGSTFTNVGNFTALVNAAGTTGTLTVAAWSSGGASQPAYNVAFDLSSVAGINDDPNFVFRVQYADSTTAVAGTNRIDNIVVAGSAIPEPATVSLLTAAAAATMLRRRRA